MLEQVLDFIHNYFEKEIVSGSFTISSGSINTDILQNGQYFKIVGSVFNDGVHQFPPADLVDESFEGEVWPLAIPPSVLSLVDDIEEWSTKYADSPYTSESFGGYSYTKASGSRGGSVTWQDVFRSRLNRWRKIA